MRNSLKTRSNFCQARVCMMFVLCSSPNHTINYRRSIKKSHQIHPQTLRKFHWDIKIMLSIGPPPWVSSSKSHIQTHSISIKRCWVVYQIIYKVCLWSEYESYTMEITWDSNHQEHLARNQLLLNTIHLMAIILYIIMCFSCHTFHVLDLYYLAFGYC